VRLDKWLWAARFFKTRSLAQKAIEAGKVKAGDERVKPAHDLKVGQFLSIRIGDYAWNVRVAALSERRGPASEAQKLYEETQESKSERQRRQDIRRFAPEPSAELKGRPTKRVRRRLEGLTDPGEDG
jgi:ribosome-associated heat shock protein Hsp15